MPAQDHCPTCHGPLGPWPVTTSAGSACSQACADALIAGRSRPESAPTDYSTMALEVDVLRKALMRQRG